MESLCDTWKYSPNDRVTTVEGCTLCYVDTSSLSTPKYVLKAAIAEHGVGLSGGPFQ